MSKIVNNRPRRVVVYARVARGESGALEAQVARPRRHAADEGWTDVTVIKEVAGAGISDEALRAISTADVVYVRDVSRLARRVDRWEHAMAVLAEAGVTVAVAGGSVVDAADPAQRFMLAVRQLVHEEARAAHAERTRRGIAAAKARREARR